MLALLLAACGDDVQGAAADLGAPDLAGPDLAGPDLALLPLEGAPCVTDVDCDGPRLLLCEYKIADGCAATGHCARIIVPTCNHVTELCGCNGNRVISGECAYPSGYASGPTTGAPLSACGDGGI